MARFRLITQRSAALLNVGWSDGLSCAGVKWIKKATTYKIISIAALVVNFAQKLCITMRVYSKEAEQKKLVGKLYRLLFTLLASAKNIKGRWKMNAKKAKMLRKQVYRE